MVDETCADAGDEEVKVSECIVACAIMRPSASGLSSYQRTSIRGKAS